MQWLSKAREQHRMQAAEYCFYNYVYVPQKHREQAHISRCDKCDG